MAEIIVSHKGTSLPHVLAPAQGTRHWQRAEHASACWLRVPVGWGPPHPLESKPGYFTHSNPLQKLQQDLSGHSIPIDPILKTGALTSQIYLGIQTHS